MSKGWLTVVPLVALAALGARPVRAAANAGAGAGLAPATSAATAASATPATAGAHLHLMRPHGAGFGQPAATPQAFACPANDLTVCLIGNRFEVTATFTAPNGGGSGGAHLVKLTDDSAYMWFFSADNVEAVFKVLNGCALDSKYWFFAGGLTNVDVVITVTDSMSSTSKRYHNPQGTPFQPIQDTSALAVCP